MRALTGALIKSSAFKRGAFKDAAGALTRPRRTLMAMALFLCVVAIIAFLLYRPIRTVFLANLYLNGLIAFVFVAGAVYSFWQVIRLERCVDWLEAFIEDRAGFDAIRPPSLMASMAAMLRERESRRVLASSTTRGILDSVATRLDEGREISRYVSALLIFLGLLGTFWGLSLTVPAVVSTIENLAPTEGESLSFERLMDGLRSQLGGMGTAFASSLLGLAGSLIIGFLELLSGHAQNRFYREFEEALSGLTRVGGGEDGGPASAHLADLLERNAESADELQRQMLTSEQERRDANVALREASEKLVDIADKMGANEAASRRMIDSQDALAAALTQAIERNKGVIGGMDGASREHLRSIDAAMLRLLEEVGAGRQDAIQEVRGEIKMVLRELRQINANRGG